MEETHSNLEHPPHGHSYIAVLHIIIYKSYWHFLETHVILCQKYLILQQLKGASHKAFRMMYKVANPVY